MKPWHVVGLIVVAAVVGAGTALAIVRVGADTVVAEPEPASTTTSQSTTIAATSSTTTATTRPSTTTTTSSTTTTTLPDPLFIPDPYQGPDRATLTQFVVVTFHEVLGREPIDYELDPLIDFLGQQLEETYRVDVELAREQFEASLQAGAQLVDFTGPVPYTGQVDPVARFRLHFQDVYAAEIDRLAQQAHDREVRDLLTGSLDVMDGMIRGD